MTRQAGGDGGDQMRDPVGLDLPHPRPTSLRAVALRAVLPQATALTLPERGLLRERLDRVTDTPE